MRRQVAEAHGLIERDGSGQGVVGFEIETRCVEAFGLGDGCCDQLPSDAVAALGGRHRHLGQFVFTGAHGDERTAAHADAVADRHEDAAASVEDRGLRMP